MENPFEQKEKSDIFKQLDICCQQIADKIGRPEISEWKNGDYVKLSALLYRQTKVAISENTLKRIFGKLKTSARYYPQKATRDALAQFIGYRDWYEFELISVQEVLTRRADLTTAPTNQLTSTKKRIRSYAILMGLTLLALSLAWFVHLKTQKLPNVKLICVNPEGKTPHSAIFKLNKVIDKENLADFSINFGDGKRTLNFNDTLINHYYEMPGRYFAILSHRGTAIDTTAVYLQSEGWSSIAEIAYDTTRVYPVLKNFSTDTKKLQVGMEDIFHAGVDTNRTFFLTYAYVKPSEIAGDHFELYTNVSTSSERAGVRCSQFDITILGEHDYHYLRLIKPACVAWSYCKFSENFRQGSKDDLRQLGHDLSEGGKLTLKVAHKDVALFVNDSLVMQSSYKRPIGKVMGIKFTFAGVGTFDKPVLRDLNTKQQFIP
ncbi:hypothetical protein H8S90_15350 [Olivibacter sp. SDN3]|uniref:hypothetical protein n=1 Tax=Olivibacter sp. SDN3 TaxID=2764720 RepID=UPI0016514457|nr:hypothetical protein [Olivibacter sp. SDN3]QNL48176.1 hypothetical protein H8S90_15350 [Olivibacter sp. SDN3]